MTDPYSGREQTQAKHFILKRYLQALAFKVLTFSDVAYVDGFSGPWQTRTEGFRDSSFMIAISVLLDAQRQIFQSGKRPRIRCFLCEKDPEAFALLQRAVAPFHKPAEGFEIMTFCGKFEDAVAEIQRFVGPSFPLIFIDPTGWKGYSFETIKPLFARPKCEVLINFMYDFINRFQHSDDPETILSLESILGGPGWRDRLDPKLERGPAVEDLFRRTLKTAGSFSFAVSAPIDKSTEDRPHFFITYGTNSLEGLKTFRQTQYDALREHEKNRANAKERKREEKTNTQDMFAGHQAGVQEETVARKVARQKELASVQLASMLKASREMSFSDVVAKLLESYMLRESNVKDICVELAKSGFIENTWGSGNRKPKEGTILRLRSPK